MIAFEEIPEAFAGVMLRADEPDAGPAFDPRSVEQRFDLAGRARACVPLVIDVQRRTLRWLDVVMGVTGSEHAVHRHSDKLATLGESLGLHYDSGARVSLGEAARWHAAARASTVLIRARTVRSPAWIVKKGRQPERSSTGSRRWHRQRPSPPRRRRTSPS